MSFMFSTAENKVWWNASGIPVFGWWRQGIRATLGYKAILILVWENEMS